MNDSSNASSSSSVNNPASAVVVVNGSSATVAQQQQQQQQQQVALVAESIDTVSGASRQPNRGDGADDSPSNSKKNNNTSNNNNKFSFQYLHHVWDDFMDDQRISRLGQCRSLERALTVCQQRQFSKDAHDPTHPLASQQQLQHQHQQTALPHHDYEQLEDFPMGIRMVRYFNWRDLQTTRQLCSNHHNNNDNNTNISPCMMAPCVREQHAIWACRAVSLGCGPQLATVKSCFQQSGPVAMLSSSTLAYETDPLPVSSINVVDQHNNKTISLSPSSSSLSSTAAFPCLDVQRQLGSCVAAQAAALTDRSMQRRQRAVITRQQQPSSSSS